MDGGLVFYFESSFCIWQLQAYPDGVALLPFEKQQQSQGSVDQMKLNARPEISDRFFKLRFFANNTTDDRPERCVVVIQHFSATFGHVCPRCGMFHGRFPSVSPGSGGEALRGCISILAGS